MSHHEKSLGFTGTTASTVLTILSLRFQPWLEQARPPMGWNSWCTDGLCNAFGDDICNEALVKSIADSMVAQGMATLGYEYVNLVRPRCRAGLLRC